MRSGPQQQATLGYFDWETMDYRRIPVNDQTEVVSLLRDIAIDEQGEPKVHAHVVLGKSDGTAMAGHLLNAMVRPTLELVLTQTPAHRTYPLCYNTRGWIRVRRRWP